MEAGTLFSNVHSNRREITGSGLATLMHKSNSRGTNRFHACRELYPSVQAEEVDNAGTSARRARRRRQTPAATTKVLRDSRATTPASRDAERSTQRAHVRRVQASQLHWLCVSRDGPLAARHERNLSDVLLANARSIRVRRPALVGSRLRGPQRRSSRLIAEASEIA